MTWFYRLTGAHEHSPQQVRESLRLDGDQLHCPNGRAIGVGRLETPTLAELRSHIDASADGSGPNDEAPRKARLRITQQVGDVAALHADVANQDSVFQVASQFNLLEMVGPNLSPEDGVGIYEDDRTQGPVCAMACGGGTIFRNYFVPLKNQTGQSASLQIDCSDELGRRLGNDNERFWKMRNGYLLPTDNGLGRLESQLEDLSEDKIDVYRSALKVGVHKAVDVTIGQTSHQVTQVYASAVPISYAGHPPGDWASIARLVLEAAYEATFHAAELNRRETGCQKLFLTLLGGGAFGNPTAWIIKAIERAATRCQDYPLNVSVVSYRTAHPGVADFIHRFDRKHRR